MDVVSIMDTPVSNFPMYRKVVLQIKEIQFFAAEITNRVSRQVMHTPFIHKTPVLYDVELFEKHDIKNPTWESPPSKYFAVSSQFEILTVTLISFAVDDVTRLDWVFIVYSAKYCKTALLPASDGFCVDTISKQFPI